MTTLRQVLTTIVRSAVCGLWALAVPFLVVGGWLYAELNWLEQPADGNDAHIKGGFYALLVLLPFMWLATTAWFLILAVTKQLQFRRAFLLSLIALLVPVAYLAYSMAMDGAPTNEVVTVVGIALAIATASAWVASWRWSRHNATWSN